MKKVPGGRRSIIFIAAFLGIWVIFFSMLFKVKYTYRERLNEARVVAEELELIRNENDVLRSILASPDEAEIIERYARERRGYAYPDERFYYDITPGN